MARLEVEIIGDSRSLEKAFARSEKSAKGFNSDMQRAGKKSKGLFGGLSKGIGLATGAIGVAGFAGAAKAAFGEMADAQKVTAQTNAVLKSTGHVAGVSAKQVDDLSTALMQKSGVDDEAIKSGENLLLTFTNVQNKAGKGNDIFDQATSTMLDMSVALGQDTKQSAIQLGKALNDPIKGVGALRRVGVSFTADQQKLIKRLVETGDTAGAQKIILGELSKEFGGSAKAAGETLPGKLNILKETLLNLGGTIAEKLSPQIQEVADRLTKWLNNTKNQKAIMDTLNTVIGVATGAIKTLKGAFNLLSGAVGGSKNAIKLLIGVFVAWKIAKVAGSVANLAGQFTTMGGNAKTATGSVKGLSGSFAGKLGLAAGVAAASWELSTFIRKIPGWDKAMKNFGGTIYDVGSKLGLVHDPMAQFEGKRILTGAQSKAIRDQARRMEGSGLTMTQTVGRISAQHPDVARRDIEVLAGVHQRAPLVVHSTVVLDGQAVGKAVTTHQARDANRKARQTSGLRG